MGNLYKYFYKGTWYEDTDPYKLSWKINDFEVVDYVRSGGPHIRRSEHFEAQKEILKKIVENPSGEDRQNSRSLAPGEETWLCSRKSWHTVIKDLEDEAERARKEGRTAVYNRCRMEIDFQKCKMEEKIANGSYNPATDFDQPPRKIADGGPWDGVMRFACEGLECNVMSESVSKCTCRLWLCPKCKAKNHGLLGNKHWE